MMTLTILFQFIYLTYVVLGDKLVFGHQMSCYIDLEVVVTGEIHVLLNEKECETVIF